MNKTNDRNNNNSLSDSLPAGANYSASVLLLNFVHVCMIQIVIFIMILFIISHALFFFFLVVLLFDFVACTKQYRIVVVVVKCNVLSEHILSHIVFD